MAERLLTGAPETGAAPKAPDAAAPAPSPAPPQPGGKPRKVRRVGTFTMGLVLVAAGLVLLAVFFVPDFDVTAALKCAPLVLVSLGGEVLAAAFTAKDARLKYDFLSMVLCFLLIVTAAGASVCVLMARYFGPLPMQRQEDIEAEWESEAYERLAGGDVAELAATLDPSWQTADSEADTLADLTQSDLLYVSVRLDGSYADEEAFARACREVMDALVSVDTKARLSYRFANEADAPAPLYTLYADSPYLQDRGARELARSVETRVYDEAAGDYRSPDEVQETPEPSADASQSAPAASDSLSGAAPASDAAMEAASAAGGQARSASQSASQGALSASAGVQPAA